MAQPRDALSIDFVVEADRQLGAVVQRIRDGRLRTNIGQVADPGYAAFAFNSLERVKGKTIIRIRPYGIPAHSQSAKGHLHDRPSRANPLRL